MILSMSGLIFLIWHFSISEFSQALRDSNKADLEKRLLEEQVNDSKALSRRM